MMPSHLPLRRRLQQWTTAIGKTLPPRPRRALRRVQSELKGRLPANVEPEIVEELDAWRELDALADAITEILQAAGIHAQRIELEAATSVQIPQSQRAAALAALRADRRAANWWVAPRAKDWQRLTQAADSDVFHQDLARVFRVLAAPNGTVLTARKLSVHLVLIPNEGTADPRPLRAQRHPHLLRFEGPIDVVYTWVDDSDPQWRGERAAIAPAGGLAVDALSAARTTDRGELRYSLRSLAMYANWVRHIWIVTSGQVPSWLAVDHPRITLVPHADIFSDPDALPTFNSHAIESQLHHIEGLAEHFIYLNDDVFFGRPVSPAKFFHGNGVARYMLSNVAIDREPEDYPRNGAMLAARNGRALIGELWGRTTTHRMQHVPHAHRRSSLYDLEERRPEVFARVARQRFRSTEDVSVAAELGHYHAHALGLAVPGSLKFRYVDVGSPYAAEHLHDLTYTRSSDTFCINEVDDDAHTPTINRVGAFLESYFPLPSPFEVDE